MQPEDSHTSEASSAIADIRRDLLSRLSGVEEHHGYYSALCPAHEDTRASLSVREHEDGVSVKCHTGCDSEAVLAAVDMTKADLYPKETLNISPVSRIAKCYYYTDEDGNTLFRVWRTPSKKFVQQRYEGGQFLNRLDGVAPVLYHLPELVNRPDEPVFVVEGEKDADRLLAEGVLATTNPMGAGKWKPEYAKWLINRTVYILPDNDEPGEKHAKDIAKTLPKARIVRLPNLPRKGDVSDWLDAGGSPERLLELAQNPLKDKTRTSSLSLRNGRELMEKKFPPIKWIVPDLIPAGSMLFGGAPKMGKSWAALGLCISVATGGLALGAFPVTEGDCCYLALEDVERRLQDRAGQILKSNLAGHQDLSRWQYTESSGRIDQGLLEDIEEEFIKEVEDPRLIVIDTLAAVKPPGGKSQNMYDQDYGALKELTAMANEYRVGMLVVTHLNQGDHKDQMNRITGSAGLTGGVDGALVLDRARGEADATLMGWHRDLKVNPELALEQVDGELGFWRYMGNAEEYQLGKEKRLILEAIANADEPMRPVEVAEELEKPTVAISKTMQRMRSEGLLKSPSYGKYEVIPGVSLPSLSISRPSCPSVEVKPNGRGFEGDATLNHSVEVGQFGQANSEVSKFVEEEDDKSLPIDKANNIKPLDELGHLDSLDTEEEIEWLD